MTAFLESASGGPRVPADTDSGALISGLSWIGDSVMSMPAIQEFKRRNPSVNITMLVKRALIPLWQLHPDIDSILELRESFLGTFMTAQTVKRRQCQRALILPHSFRSALIPFLARVPERVGMPGHHRDWMLTGVVKSSSAPGREHQVFEYFDLMGLADVDCTESPSFPIPGELIGECRDRLTRYFADFGRRPLIGILPGAAFGPSKCWPTDSFAEVGRRLLDKDRCQVIVLGSLKEKEACLESSVAMGKSALDLAGETSLQELAAMLSLCDVVIANDSGGMHLAAAVGTRVVAIFGVTDSSKTGPLGSDHRVLGAEHVAKSRDLARDSEEASKALLSIEPDAVYQAAVELLK